MKGDTNKQKPKMGGMDEMQQKLYSKNTTVKPYMRNRMSDTEHADVPESWAQPQPVGKPIDLVEKPKKKKQMTGFTKLFLASFAFFAFSIIGALLVFMYRQNDVGFDAVRMVVLGPNSVPGGEEISFDITLFNDNQVDLILTDVVVNYPRGTVTADDEGLPLGKDIVSIDEIRSGLQDTARFKAILFGKEGDTQDINIVFQYRVPGSDNIFFKERIYQVKIESSPVTVTADHNSTHQSGDDVSLTVEIVSNSTQRVRNLLLSIDYPFGFEFTSSSIPYIDDATYDIGDLYPGEKVRIRINGSISGQNEESRTFRYAVGMRDSVRTNIVGSILASNESVITIARPSILLDLVVNNNAKDVYVAHTDEVLGFALHYDNSLASKLIDTVLTITMEGIGYDKKDIRSDLGYYRSLNNTITWTRADVPALAEIESGDGGSLGFQLRTPDASNLVGIAENPQVLLTLGAQATNFELGGVEKIVSHKITKLIKLATDITLESSLLYSAGPLVNTGPLPPKIGELTTYTVHWELFNTTNKVKGVVVKARLPRYVSFSGNTAPLSANVTFDERSREITWNVDELNPGTGYAIPTRELYFTVVYEPSLDQLDSTPNIILESSVSALDTFTNQSVSNTARAASTRIGKDPLYEQSQAKVVE